MADDTPEIHDSPVASTCGFDGMNGTGEGDGGTPCSGEKKGDADASTCALDGMNGTGEGDDGTPRSGEKKGDADASTCGFNGMNGTGEGYDDNELNQSMYLVLMFDYNFCASISQVFFIGYSRCG